MFIDFTNGPALILLLLLGPIAYLSRGSLAGLSPLRARLALTARLALMAALILAVAGIRLRTTSYDLALLFLLDVSASVTPEQQSEALQFINREIARADPADFVGVIAFADYPSVELAPVRKESLADGRLSEITSAPARNYTDISAALRLAAAIIPESAAGRLVLISDGNENIGNAAAEANLLSARGIQVYTRGFSSALADSEAEVAIRELSAPEVLSEGEAFDLRVTVDATRNTTAKMRVFRDDTQVAERDIDLVAGGDNVFIVPQRNDQKGFYSYRAEVEAIDSDFFTQNNSREAFALVEGRPRTLYLYGDSDPSPGIVRVLREGQFAADVRMASAAPGTVAGFQNYDLVIFDNVPAAALKKEQLKMVQTYVRELGGGFVMIGGDKSFGPGGYYKTPVEETLPVSLDVRQKKHFPSLALALVVDKSGSMAGLKLDMAIEAASVAVDFLSERDWAGVIAFDDDAQPIVDLTRVENKGAVKQQIRTVQASGGTDIYEGLKLAHEWLVGNEAQLKHVILLSDGQSDGDFPGITTAFRTAEITLSSVAVGEDADHELMSMLASAGGGRFYATEGGENLPRIFAGEAFLAAGTTVIEEPFVPKLAVLSRATDGINWNSAPMLGGYIGAAERDEPGSPAITSLVSHKGDPVFAIWQYGLGRSAAFTSDGRRWAKDWLNWPGYGQFWTQVFRDTVRHRIDTDLAATVSIRAGRGFITVDAIDPAGTSRNNLKLRARVLNPDLSTTEVELEQTAAGRYEAEFAAVDRGAYLASVSSQEGEMAPVTGAVNSYSPEFSILAADSNLLETIGDITGGKAIPADLIVDGQHAPEVNLFARTSSTSTGKDVWESLVLAAVLLLPLDVGLRRINLTSEQIEGVRFWIRSRFARRREEAEEGAGGLKRLKKARGRVRFEGGFGERSVRAGGGQPGSADETTLRTRAAAGPVTDAGSRADISEGEGKSLAARLLEVKQKKER